MWYQSGKIRGPTRLLGSLKFESLENVELIDNVSLFCDEMNCSILDQGHLLYWDDDHLNERGSRYFARHIIEESKFL